LDAFEGYFENKTPANAGKPLVLRLPFIKPTFIID